MLLIEVDDVQPWHELAQQVATQPEFKDSVRVKPPELIDGRFHVLHVIDPVGVLLVFVQ